MAGRNPDQLVSVVPELKPIRWTLSVYNGDQSGPPPDTFLVHLDKKGKPFTVHQVITCRKMNSPLARKGGFTRYALTLVKCPELIPTVWIPKPDEIYVNGESAWLVVRNHGK